MKKNNRCFYKYSEYYECNFYIEKKYSTTYDKMIYKIYNEDEEPIAIVLSYKDLCKYLKYGSDKIEV